MRLFGYFLVTLVLVAGGIWVVAQNSLKTFTPGEIIKSSEVNQNFQLLNTALEGKQSVVTEGCESGSSIREINSDGTVTCEPDDVETGGGGGDITEVQAGSGLTGGGESGDVTLSVDTSAIQSRVTGTCEVGTAVRRVNPDGSVTCEPITKITSGTQVATWYKYGYFPLTFEVAGEERAYIRVQQNSPTENFMQFQLKTSGGSNIAPITMLSTGTTRVAGNLHVSGTLSKGSGSFKIDHPLDPEGSYLSHSFVESPDMMNIYNGNVVTDEKGYATVVLPAYVEALNQDFRYQLTALGQFAQAIVASKIEGNTFVIQTDKPNVEVSWQVTGIRQDPYALAHPIVVEEEKPLAEQGRYLHPDAYGLSPDRGIGSASELHAGNGEPTD